MELQNKVKMQRNQIIARQQQHLLPVFQSNPEALLQKKVKHKCREPGGTVEWFMAQATGIHSKKQDVMQTEYTVVYDSFPEDEWHFPLQKDMKNGDLVILN